MAKKDEELDWSEAAPLVFFRLSEAEKRMNDLIIKAEVHSNQLNELKHETKNIRGSIESLSRISSDQLQEQKDWHKMSHRDMFVMKVLLFVGIFLALGVVTKENLPYLIKVLM